MIILKKKISLENRNDNNEIRKVNLKSQKELRSTKFKSINNNNERQKKLKIKQVLEDMCQVGNIMKQEIIETKKSNPKAYISIKEATKDKNKDIFCLGLLANALENIGIITAIERGHNYNENNNKGESLIVLQFLMNGMLEKKKYDMSFDFGKKENNKLLNDKNEQEVFDNNLKNKISDEYGIPEDDIIITHPPQKGNHYNIQLIFHSNEFNDLDLKQFRQKFKNDDTLCYLKDIQTTLIMEGCKLSQDMLDSRGNRYDNFVDYEEANKSRDTYDSFDNYEVKNKGKRGGYDYYPPYGWKGFGLSVLGKYDNGNDDWIASNGNKNEWAVAYHGIGSKNAFKLEDAVNNIVTKGFKIGQARAFKNDDDDDLNHKGQKVSIGIYCSPKPSVMDDNAKWSKTDTIVNGKRYKVGFMMRVKPGKIRISSSFKDYWVLNPTTDEMRPYRILVKEN